MTTNDARLDIVVWLRGLGLEQYEAAFRDNDIDAEMLPTLTADDLRELGIASLGHRKKLLAAIAALRDDPQPATEDARRPETSERAAHAAPPTAPSSSAERRQ